MKNIAENITKLTSEERGQYFWLCAEFYRGSGGLSRTWIEQSDESPDTPTECVGQYPSCQDERAPWAHAMSHIPCPFNGMGGEVISRHHSLQEAKEAELRLLYDDDELWDSG